MLSIPPSAIGSGTLLGVLKLRTSFQSFLRGAWQDQFALDKLELGNGNGDIVLCQPEIAAGIDDGVGDRLVGRDDDVINRSDTFIVVIVNSLPEDCTLDTPTQGNVTHLLDADAEQGCSCHLRMRNGRRGQSNTCKHQNADRFHFDSPSLSPTLRGGHACKMGFQGTTARTGPLHQTLYVGRHSQSAGLFATGEPLD